MYVALYVCEKEKHSVGIAGMFRKVARYDLGQPQYHLSDEDSKLRHTVMIVIGLFDAIKFLTGFLILASVSLSPVCLWTYEEQPSEQ